MADTTILHNPRCSKSREALRILRERGEEVRVVEYLKEPPTVAELDRICSDLGLAPEQLLRVREARFRELNLHVADGRSRQEWLRLMVENPVLIERPIVVRGTRAVLGRPPEKILDLL